MRAPVACRPGTWAAEARPGRSRATTPHPRWKREAVVDQDRDGYSVEDGDCNDFDSSVYPGASEVIVADDKDDDCDGEVDEGTGGYDPDGDGVTDWQGDCGETDPTVYVGADEVVEGRRKGGGKAPGPNACRAGCPGR